MPNSSNSTVAGYLAPTILVGQEDADLSTFLQDLVSGITGMPGNMVRPRWQKEPPVQPEIDENWASVGKVNATPEFGAAIVHSSSGDGSDYAYQNEEIEILCSFYGPNCGANRKKLIVGLNIGQNRENMQQNGYGLVEVINPVVTADLLHEQWVRRMDITVVLRKADLYQYPVLNVLGMDGMVTNNTAIAGTITTGSQTVRISPSFGWGIVNPGVMDGWGTGNWI